MPKPPPKPPLRAPSPEATRIALIHSALGLFGRYGYDGDRLTYDEDDDKVTATGHVSLTDAQGNVAFMDHVVLTDHMRNGALEGFGALIRDELALWRKVIDSARLKDQI